MGMLLMVNEHKNSVIRRILKKYMEGEALNSAILLWDKQYSRQSLDKLSFYVFEIATTSTLRGLRKQILIDLQNYLQSEDLPKQTSLANDQQVEETVSLIDTEISQPSITFDENGLKFFFEQLVSPVMTQDEDDVYDLIQELLDEEVIAQVKQDFLNWFQTRQSLGIIINQHSDIQKVANVLYTILCEYFGPVKADRLMSQAIAQTEQQYPDLAVKQFL